MPLPTTHTHTHTRALSVVWLPSRSPKFETKTRTEPCRSWSAVLAARAQANEFSCRQCATDDGSFPVAFIKLGSRLNVHTPRAFVWEASMQPDWGPEESLTWAQGGP